MLYTVLYRITFLTRPINHTFPTKTSHRYGYRTIVNAGSEQNVLKSVFKSVRAPSNDWFFVTFALSL